MATISLLGAIPSTRESKLQTLKWNALFQTFPTQLSLRSTNNPASLITSLKLCNKGSNFTVKCLVNSKSWNLFCYRRDVLSYEDSVLTATQETSVIKLQVGLLGTARSLQRDLDRIAEVADTSTLEGLSYVLTETTLALLRQPDYFISGYSSVDVKRSIEDGEKRFNELSIEERGKFDEETLVNVNNIKRKGTRSRRPNGLSNEYIVITILVAAEGVTKLPSINSSADLKEALQKLASILSSKTMAVEVLWTPQNENDTLTERELLEDYPLLMPL